MIDKTVHTPLKVIGIPQVFGIGMLYDRMCAEYVSFGRHDHGKLMGLAAYGDDRLLLKYPFSCWVTERNGQMVCNGDWRFARRKIEHSSQKLKTRFIKMVVGMRDYVVAILRIIILLLQRRKDDVRIFKPIVFEAPARDPSTQSLPDVNFASAAFAAQKIFEYFSTNVALRLRSVTHCNNLCVSGGCALNIDANRNFLTKAGFQDIFIQPASSDCGIALGCALWGKHVILKQPRDWVMRSASLGRRYSEEEIELALHELKEKIEWKMSSNIAKDAAKLIADGKIIGWFQGGSEYGPRALGNRSILCDASIKDMRDILNSRIKHREMWRPFATSILADYLEEWFDLKANSATGFMLLAAEIPKEKRALVPSIVHVDNTCRMQTVTKEDNGIYFDLINEFNKITGIPLVLNTSFNLGGEPIVETPNDAIDTFLRTNMDYLVLGDTIVWKRA
ncbi:MAG: hypothetical protein KBD24_02955 [Candidatus Pacebacteria bacterium]|nr:hypothetical protein [Candidatus Paceibacterota bacterium]